jgi:uncharacterized repeat protein (TIGR01451 family)/fimbrial isopeptide formation D2 family protein
MRTTHKLNLTTKRALLISGVLILVAGLLFAFAPVRQVAAARRALAARVNASPTAEKMLAVAPAPIRRVIKQRFALAAPAYAASPAAAMMFAPYTVTKTANPADGSTIGQGQTITYTITITNNGSTDTTLGAGGFIRFADPNPTQVTFTAPTVTTQPGGGSTAWTCAIDGGGDLACLAGDGVGAGVETFAAGALVALQVTATVNPNAPAGSIISNSGTFEFQDDAVVPPNVTQNSNTTNHFVSPAVDLAVAKVSQTSQPPPPDAPNGVLAGGNNVPLNTLADIGNEGRGNISYVITFSNLSGNNAVNTTIEDSVPALSGALVNNPPPPNGPGGLVAGPVPGQPIIAGIPTVTSISINGGGSATQFRFNCVNFGLGQTFTCTPADNTAINPAFGPGTLPAGFQGRIGYRIQAFADATPGGILVNQARITTNGATDINAGNNTSLPTNNVIYARTDVAIVSKTTSNATPVAGGANFTYTILIANNGPSNAANVVMTDPLPAGILFVGVAVPAGSGFSCSGPPVNTNGIVSCSNPNMPPTLAPNAPVPVTITARAAAGAAAGPRTNTANVVTTTPEPDPPGFGNNSGSVNQTVVVNAELTITKLAGNATDGGPTVNAGENLVYRIQVMNAGPSLAQNVQINDVLPANLTFVSLTGDNGFAGACTHDANANSITCNNVTFGAVGTHNLNIVARVNPDAPAGNITNTAIIANPGTGTAEVPVATADITVIRRADLQITKDDSPDAVLPGGLITYTIKVKNIGPSDAGVGDFQVLDAPFPPGGTTLQGTITANGFDCNLGTTFPCINTAPLPVGATATIQYTVKVDANFNNGQPGGSVNNTATVQIIGAAIGDPNANNNQSNTVTPVGPSADLQLTKTATPAAVIAGSTAAADTITYTINYRNNGQGDAINVQITDTVQANLLAVGTITAVGLSCNGTTPTPGVQFVCTPNAGAFGANLAGVLPFNAAGTITFQVRVPANVAAGSLISNAAKITSVGPNATPDPNTSNNTQGATSTVVNTSADLSITKTDAPDPVIAGQNLTYTITVNNAGPSDAQNVVISDELPASLSYVSATSNDASVSCTFVSNKVSCTKATFAAGGPAVVVTLVVRVDPNVAAGTVLTNPATVGSSTSDPNTANNTATTTTTVQTDADLIVSKVDNPDPVIAGTNLNYRITVRNNGPSDARSFVLTDTLPAGTTFVSFNGTGALANAGVCSHNGAAPGVITCQLTNPPNNLVLPAGVTWQLDVVVKVNADTVQAPLPQTASPDNLVAPLPPLPAGVLQNEVDVTWVDSDADVDALEIFTRTTVRHESDMTIKKQAPDFVVAGTRADYRLTVNNKGPSTVLGDAALPGSIVVWDLLPVGTTLANITGNPFISPGGPGGFVCRAVANQGPANNQTLVLCYNAAGAAGNFPVNGNIEIIIKVDTTSTLTEGQNIINCAQVSLRNTDATPEIDPAGGGQHDNTNPAVGVPAPLFGAASGNNESCDSTVVRTSADLGIAKTSAPVTTPPGSGLPVVALPPPNSPTGSVAAGGYITYTVPFGNAGPSSALNVRITDHVPGNTAYVGAVNAAGAFTAGTTFQIAANTTPAVPANQILLDCTVTGNPGSATITCVPAANTGVNPTYVAGVLPAGYTGTLTFYVKVNESVTGGTIVGNAANITSAPQGNAPGTPDPNPGNNTSLTTSNLVVANSQLLITKTLNPGQPFAAAPPAAANALIPGTQYTYTISVTNTGPSDVSNVRVIDTIPANARYVAINQIAPFNSTFTCAPPTGIVDPAGNGGQVQCTAPLLSANAPNNVANFSITIFVDPATKTDVTNRADVNATINNFNTSTSTFATVTNPVGPTSDIVLRKSHTNTSADGLSVVAGTMFEYTIDVTNNGPSTAAMPRLIDIIPPTQTIVAKAGVVPPVADITLPAGWTCTGSTPNLIGATGPLTCTGPSLPPNKNQNGSPNPAGTIQFKFKVLQDPLTPQPAPTFYDNCVTFESMSFDPTTAGDGPMVQPGLPDITPDAGGLFVNASVCDRVNITFVSPVAGAKVDTPDPVIAGNLLTYTITGSPAGTSAALNFTIEDPLPQGTVFISAVASPGASLMTPVVNTNGIVKAVWDIAGGTPGGLTPPGTVRTLTIVVRVCPDFQQIRALTDAQMCVPNLTNTASIYANVTPPNVPANPTLATSTTTVQAQSNLGITKAGPASAIANQVVTYTLTVTNAGPSNANNVLITDVLPKGFTLIPGSIVITPTGGTLGVGIPATPIGLVAGSPTTDAAGTQTVGINLGVVGAANQCGPVIYPTTVTVTLQARVPTKHPNIVVTNAATVSSTNCLAETGTLAVQTNPFLGFPAIITPGTGMLVNNRAFFDTIIGPPANDPGPGSVSGYPATAEISDQKAGSILFYPIYTSDAANPNSQNTRISITNISSVDSATVHLFVVDGASCSVLDAFICLTPNQTATFLASDFDPGATGYIMAVAVDNNTGLPISYNCLIGDEFVKFATGHQANLGAEAVAAVMFNPAGTLDPTATSVNLNFNGMNYNRLPSVLASDNIPSRADQNNTLLIVDAIGGNFTRSGSTLVSLFGFLYDDAEIGYSFTQNVSTCQFRSQLSNSFPRLFNGFTNIIPAGRSGWMKLWSTSTTIGIIGAQINQNPNVASSSGAFNQGHNLHKLTLNPSVTLTVPTLPPACQ